MNATLRQLRVFASVARHLSFARAAEELGLTAPAISMQIKELETETGLRFWCICGQQSALGRRSA
jgi:DNA-binding transcriptional LysR family regulator